MMIITSCQDSPFFIEYTPVDTSGWDSHDYQRYCIGSSPTDRTASFTVGVRTTPLYPHTNISLRVRLFEQGRVVMTDTVHFNLEGRDHLSLSQALPLSTHELPLHKTYPLKKDSIYRLRIYHIMRLDPLPGISDVGITVR